MTSSIDKLQRILFDDINIDDTIVFISGMGHNSNYLPWLELGVKVAIVNYDTSGSPDLNHLKKLLDENKNKKNKIESFVACSNLTGIKVEWERIVKIMHDEGTPGIFQVIRAGLTIKLKGSMEFDKIQLREQDIATYLLKELSKIKDVIIYGSLTKDRLTIVAFNIKGKTS